MAEYQLGPCSPWISGDDVCCDPVVDPVTLDEAAAVATDILFHLSGMQFTGVCEHTVRPGYHKCNCGMTACCFPQIWAPDAYWWPDRTGFDAFVCCDCSRARLGFSPIAQIVSVEIDGISLDPAEYAVEEFVELVRLDGQCWPTTDTWEVKFTSGVAPPPSARRAAEAFACEIAKGMVGADGCQLPQRVTTLTRQGVSIAFDPFEFLTNGKTGIYIVDLFLATHNPANLHSSPTVAIPNETPQVVRHT